MWEQLISKRMKSVFLVGVLAGLGCHLFFMTNVIKNYDGVIQTDFGAGLSSGRWLLDWAGGYTKMLWGDYNIPWLASLLSIIVFAMCATIIVEIFNFQKQVAWWCWPVLFLSFPTVACTLLFSNTTLFYAVAVFLMVLACYVTEKWKYGFLVAIVLAGCSIGIYQAYLPMMISVFSLLILQQLLFEMNDIKSILIKGFKYIGTIVGSLLFYFVMLKWRLHHCGASLSDYQGINQMGKSGAQFLWNSIKTSYIVFFETFSKDYASISITPIHRFFRLILGVTTLIFLACHLIKLGEKKRWTNLVLSLAAIMILPIAFGSIHIMCPNSYVYTLMVFAQVFFFSIFLIVLDPIQMESKKNYLLSASQLTGVLAILIIGLNYAYQDNMGYANLYYAGEQTKAYFNRMITKVEQTPGFTTEKEWVVLGETIADPMYRNPWAIGMYTYGGIGDGLLNAWSRDYYIQQMLGYNAVFAPGEEVLEVMKRPDVEKMPVYPNYGSIFVDEKYVVIKLSNDYK